MGKATVKKKIKKQLAVVDTGKTAINVLMGNEYYKTLTRIKNEKGFSSEQEVIRFIIKDFFNRNRY